MDGTNREGRGAKLRKLVPVATAGLSNIKYRQRWPCRPESALQAVSYDTDSYHDIARRSHCGSFQRPTSSIPPTASRNRCGAPRIAPSLRGGLLSQLSLYPPACGERGPLHKGGLAEAEVPLREAQTRGEAPSPGICAKSAQIPTSPRKRER